MTSALWVAKTGLDAQQMRMSVISNNLANASTTGFKQGRAQFEDLLYQNVRQVGAQSSPSTQLPSGLMLGTGTRIVSTAKNFTQGNLVQTGNNLDLAIDGRGFFQITLPSSQTAYTRDGSFHVDSTGQIVNSSGYPIDPPITLPPGASSVTIDSSGNVNVVVPPATTPTLVGTIQIADFINPAGLQAIGGNLFLYTGSSGSPITGTPGSAGMGSISQGFLETSNVNVVEELVDMIETQRAYEMNSKAIATTDQMLQYVNNNL